jgi:hypothetical protein
VTALIRMTARGQRVKKPPLVEVFRERAEARAYLFAHGVLDLHEAVDRLQQVAEANGLINLVGISTVQAILSEAFAPWRDIG